MDEPIIPELAAGTNFDATNTCLTWPIANVQVKCDIDPLGAGLNKLYFKLLEEGKQLTLNCSTFMSQYQAVTYPTDLMTNATRSFTRLKSVFVSLWKRYANPRNTRVGK